MNKLNFNIEYEVNGNKKLSSCSNEDFTLDIDQNGNEVKVTINCVKPTKFTDFSLNFNYNFNDDDKFFANGFQSWTNSKEFSKTEKMRDMGFLAKSPLNNIFGFTNVGDYNFVKYPKTSGIFHSHGYAYVTTKNGIFLIGSLSDRTGYTVITADMNKNVINVKKDLEGTTISGEYVVFDLAFISGKYDETFDEYFALMGIKKPNYPVLKGYTTWYNYYQNINEEIVLRDLDGLSKIKNANVFQIDDGYQTKVGEWLNIDAKKFPNGIKPIADAIHNKGLKAGIWLCPFGVQKNSSICKLHDEWFVKDENGKINCGSNWGGFYALDIYNEEVRAYLKKVFATFIDYGFDLFKLDFLFAAAIVPRNNKTRGEIMYDAIDLLRECVGDKQILGCGTPLMPCFGKTEYMRVGADMGLKWKKTFIQKLGHREDVSSKDAIYNNLYRRHLDNRAFIADPDVTLIRSYNIGFTFEQRKTIAKIHKLFGGVQFTSDDSARYDDEQTKVLNFLFSDDVHKILSVTENNDVVTIKYILNGENKTMLLDMKNCVEIM